MSVPPDFEPLFTFSYLLKADEDTFVRLGPLKDALGSIKSDDPLYWGYFTGKAFPIRKGGKKYFDPSYHVCDYYVPYAQGGGYVVSAELVRFVGEEKQRFLI